LRPPSLPGALIVIGSILVFTAIIGTGSYLALLHALHH
jgi:hypothetical protein